MNQYEATFEIDSRADAEAVRLLVERAYDALREETRESEREGAAPSEMLIAFRAIRDATRRPTSGALTITYEQFDGDLED